VLELAYSGTTTGTGTATTSAACLFLNYDLAMTAGTHSCTAFNVAYIDFDINATSPAFASGMYNLLYVNGTTGASPAYAATCTLSGIKVDLSGMTVTDTDLVLNGLSIVVPAGGTSSQQINGITINNSLLTLSLVNGTSHIYSNAALITDMPVTSCGAGMAQGNGVKYMPFGKRGALGMFVEEIFIDLNAAGASSSTTDLDIIGKSAAGAAHIGQITAALNGVVTAITMTCTQVPATGVTDINVCQSSVSTGVFDDAGSGLTNYALLLDAAGAWTLGLTKVFSVNPTANYYLYLLGGAAGTPGAYSAGKFVIRIYGV
jgi:hypothetical protein